MSRSKTEPLSPKPDQTDPGQKDPLTWRFRLYVAGDAPHSLLAIANLKAICEEFLPGAHEIELIDVLKEPGRTLQDQVIVTPTLVRLFPAPVSRLIGNLSDRKKVLLSLGLVEASNE